MKIISKVAEYIKPRSYERDTFIVVDSGNNELEATQLITFTNIFTRKSYIVYTTGEIDEEGKTSVFANIYDKHSKDGKLHCIETEKEWSKINKKLNSFGKRELWEDKHINTIGLLGMTILSVLISLLIIVLIGVYVNGAMHLSLFDVILKGRQLQFYLASIQILGCAALTVTNDKMHYNIKSGIANALLPLSVYALYLLINLGVMYTYKIVYIIGVIVITVGWEISQSIFPKCTKLISYIRRVLNKLSHHKLFISAIIAMFVLSFGFLVFEDNTVYPSTDITNHVESTDGRLFITEQDELFKLKKDVWCELDLQQRLDVAQVIVNIETTYLGTSPVVIVTNGYLTDKNTLGAYSHTMKRIEINKDLLLSNDAKDVVDTICHEMYHCYQHCLEDTLSKLNEKDRKLLYFYDFQYFTEESEILYSYPVTEEECLDYYYSYTEYYAREYAQQCVYEYFDFISEYFDKNNENLVI